VSRKHDKHHDHVLGIDIGGSGIKAAPVDLHTGEFVEDRRRIATPDSSDPDSIAEVTRQLCEHFQWEGTIGCTFPGVVRHGRTLTAANLDPAWVNVKAEKVFAEKIGHPVTLINDADAVEIAQPQPLKLTSVIRFAPSSLRYSVSVSPHRGLKPSA